MATFPSDALSTGLPRLDGILKGLMPGDNVVWLVDDIEEYVEFVRPFCRYARERGYQLVYFRFANHPPLLGPDSCVSEIVELDPQNGFEAFVTDMHRVIQKHGRQGYYVFDRLSHLAADWYSDQMLGNFFQLTCPYVYDHEGIAYFALRKGYHSFHATAPIAETTQILIDVYRLQGKTYVHPLKVQQRYSPTMYMLHEFRDGDFVPVLESDVNARVLQSVEWSGVESASLQLDVWNRTILEAKETLQAAERGEGPYEDVDKLLPQLLRMVVTREERVLRLAQKCLRVRDVLEIGKRMIGTGLIGGKSVGMLLARAIMRKKDKRWVDLLEEHDSFYVGSDVFYTYLVRNGCWWVRSKQKDATTFLEGAQHARQRILTGAFPDYIEKKFSDMLDYFGQSPIIVRSSSLLEDNFGNAFSGKYESVFCPNQGSRHRRLEDFLSAVKTIYASSMSEKALMYRAQRGLLDRDEQMSLLVQRVSGTLTGDLFFPQAAGVAFSFNPYVWTPDIDPKAGVLRLVFGLGTRAVDRADDDYTRVVALNAPEKKPEAGFDDAVRYTQRKVDVLDLGANQLTSIDLSELIQRNQEMPLDFYISRDDSHPFGDSRIQAAPALTFQGLFSQTSFVADMREVLSTLEAAYEYPVDIEFAVNVFADGRYRLNLLQCRPFQVREGGPVPTLPTGLPREQCILETTGPVIGHSRRCTIDRIIYVVPSVYSALPNRDRYAVARLVGKLTHLKGERGKKVILIGPGRWGTTTPTLGVPVSTAEINPALAVCEIVAMREGLVPDVSLGTHFFNDLVESDMLYLALFPNQDGCFMNSDLLEQSTNRLKDFVPEAERHADAIRVVEAQDLAHMGQAVLYANTYNQRVILCLEPGDKKDAGCS